MWSVLWRYLGLDLTALTATVTAHIEAAIVHTEAVTAHIVVVTIHAEAARAHTVPVTAYTETVSVHIQPFEPSAQPLKNGEALFSRKGVDSQVQIDYFFIILRAVNVHSGRFFVGYDTVESGP